MNFLGHSLISLEIDVKENKETLFGNFTGDFYKGLVEKIDISDNLKEGITLHRTIDRISDRKENLLNELLVEKFGIFKGIVSDMFVDHFLSKNFYDFCVSNSFFILAMLSSFPMICIISGTSGPFSSPTNARRRGIITLPIPNSFSAAKL